MAKDETDIKDYPSRVFEKKEIVIEPGKIDTIFWILKGGVKAYYFGRDKEERVINDVKALSYLSFIYSHNKLSNPYYFQALGRVEVTIIPVADLEKKENLREMIIKESLKWGERMVREGFLVNRGDSLNRVAAVIYNLAVNYGRKSEGKLMLDFPLTHKMIAGIAGMARETASLQVIKLRKEGYISQKSRRITIVEADKMKELLAD